MKKLLLLFCTAACLAACQTADKKTTRPLTEEERMKAGNDTANFTTIQWLDSTSQDLGGIKEGQVVEISYRFKNSGTKSLVIESVNAQCGCTVAEKPEQPFAPGEEGVIKAKFDSKDKVGAVSKYLTVTANTNPDKEHRLIFNVQVSN
ncbi:MAG: DUF1573 domain-containing protein [Chitinophagaceae bacterium]